MLAGLLFAKDLVPWFIDGSLLIVTSYGRRAKGSLCSLLDKSTNSILKGFSPMLYSHPNDPTS